MTRTLLRGGSIYTQPHGSRDAPHATAMCVENGKVVWTGDDDESAHFADNAERTIELDGRLVTPAFVDSHVHLAQSGLAAQSLDLSGAASAGAALGELADYARRTTFPVVLAFGWDDTRWPEQRCFTRAEVDRAVGARPAYLARVDVHSAVVSSAFLDAFPRISEEDGYEADGRVSREAHHLARQSVFRLTPASAREDAISLALRNAASQGIGMVHELGAPHLSPAEDFATIRTLRAEGPMPDVVGYWGRLGGVEEARELGCAGAAGDLCVDGAIGSRTAAMHAPYADSATSGHLYLTTEQVKEHVIACTRADLQAGFHCIGDRAISHVVDGFRQAAEVVGAPALLRARHRLEHLEMVSAEDMLTLGRLGVTASVQPMFDGLWGGEDSLYAQRLGVGRARPMNPYASLIRAGVALALGSDTPVTPFGPWAALRAAAWHHTEDERITVRAAFDAHTRGGWMSARLDSGGVIARGAPASLAVWDVEVFPDLEPDRDLPSCAMTLVRGHVAFEETGALE